MSAFLFTAMGVRFVSWRLFERDGSPFDGGLFGIMHDVNSSPEFWSIWMFAALPTAIWFTIDGSMKMRILHRFFITFVWGMFAGANIPAGFERSFTTFGVTMLWAVLLISICQTYALVDRALASGEILSTKGQR